MSELTETGQWRRLAEHAAGMCQVQMRDLFAADSSRFEKYSLCFNDILIDYSKNIITDESMRLLLELARVRDVEGGGRACLPARPSTTPRIGPCCTRRCAIAPAGP